MTGKINIRLDGAELMVHLNESVLDACLRSAIEVPFSCRAGSCQTCLLRCTQGVVPQEAQRGLRPELRSRGYLLACQCRPTAPMTLTRPRQDEMVTSGCLAGRPPGDHEDDGLAKKVEAPMELEPPAPDPALWAELGNGVTVRAVLEDFYRQVYADQVLAPFFQKVTMDRSVDKQYSFLKQLMTGERVYFGDRPRNAHHWMVISNELFDYRQALMLGTLEKHGLSAQQIARWTRLELHYRPDIVKSAAWPRRVNGVDLPLDGYASEILSASTLCDHCGAGIEAGTAVSYHLRLGHVSCASCASGGPRVLPAGGDACDAIV